MYNLIVEDAHGHYRLRLSGEPGIEVPIKPIEFRDPLRAQSFVRGLRTSVDQWRRILHDINRYFGSTPCYLPDQEVYVSIAAMMVRGPITVYPITHLNHSGPATTYPIVPAGAGAQYRFIPASLLLVKSPRDVQIFYDKGVAEKFIQLLNLTDAQIEAIIQANAPRVADGEARNSTQKTAMLIALLAKSEVVLLTERVSASPPKSTVEEEVSTNAPGNRPMSLGPHAGGEANRSNVVSQTSVPKGFDDVYSKAPMAKTEIDVIADDIAGGAGGTVAKAPIKSRARAIEKINGDYGGDPHKIKDIARNTIVVPPEKVDSVAAQLKVRGADVKVIDGEKNPLGYSGVNATMMTKAGIPAEIQVNSPVMIYAKESEENARSILGSDMYNKISSKVGMPGGKGHQIYEQWRVLKPDSSEARVLAEQSKSYYDAIRRSVYGSK